LILTPYVASLRIYEPLESFDFYSQLRWVETSESAPTIRQESENTIYNSISFNRWHSSQEGVHLIYSRGKKFVCPWSLKRRAILAMQKFNESTPSSITPFFVSPELASILSWDVIENNAVPHIISARWIIPPSWFTLFRIEERLITLQGTALTCIYRTDLAQAKVRGIETHKIVKRAFGVGSIESEIAELIDWLNMFDDDSLIELDYGGLAPFVEKTLRLNHGVGLLEDSSVNDVLASITALANGDGVSASKAYSRLLNRWRMIAQFEQAQ
jgi:hypothetical protein